jgi:hypothetical protein
LRHLTAIAETLFHLLFFFFFCPLVSSPYCRSGFPIILCALTSTSFLIFSPKCLLVFRLIWSIL